MGPQLRDIRARFPLPGTYHFRFKMRYEQNAIWMDVTNEDSQVPMYEEKIFCKVLRLSWTDAAPGKSAAQPAAPSQPAQQPQQQQRRASAPAPVHQEDMLGFGDAPKSNAGYPNQ